MACTADGIQNVWVLSASPPHVDRLQIGILGLDAGVSFAVPASPVAIGAREQEVWVAAAAGSLTRFRLADSATVSFSGFGVGSPLALAVGQTTVWMTKAGNELVKVRRTDGAALATYPTGLDPIAVAEAADGSAWTIDKGSNGATRVSSAGATGSIALGGTPSAIVADSRRVWVSLPGKLVHFKADGTKEGEVAVSYMDTLDGQTALTGTHLALDAVGRIWVLDAGAGVAVPVWGRKEGE